MKRYRGKLFGAALGFTFGGPIGAIIGAAAGHLIDTTEPLTQGRYLAGSEGELAFITSLTLLLAGTARADGMVTESEKRTIKNFFKHQVGYGAVEYHFIERIIDESFVRPLNLDETCAAIHRRASYEERLFLVRLNYQIAVSDGELNELEESYIEEASQLLGIEPYDYTMVKNQFLSGQAQGGNHGRESAETAEEQFSDPYTVLGIVRDSPDNEVVKAYRNLVNKYHPDKVSHLGREFIELANRKFMIIQKAYEKIQLERGLQ
jgi:DnaJ like chaperone protein